MRPTLITGLAVVFMLSTGCKSEEEAREYAQNLIGVLRTYQAQLEAKAGAEKKAYEELARIYRSSAEADLLATLGTERRERGDDLADQVTTGKPLTGPALKDRLKQYAEVDVERTRALLFRTSDDRDKYLTELNEISVDAAGIESLINALQVLADKPSLVDRIGYYKEFGETAKSCLNELVCNDLAGRLDAVKKQLAAKDISEEKLAELRSKQNAIEIQQKSAGCDSKPSCPKESAGANRR